MVYGIIKLINFAHGDIYMLGAFWGYYVINQLHFNFIWAMLSAMVFCAILGVIIEYFAYRRSAISPDYRANYSNWGFLPIGERHDLSVHSQHQQLSAGHQDGHLSSWRPPHFNIQLLILGTACLLMLILELIIKRTKMGRAMRAVSVDLKPRNWLGSTSITRFPLRLL